jgi:hypothetical protein
VLVQREAWKIATDAMFAVWRTAVPANRATRQRATSELPVMRQ